MMSVRNKLKALQHKMDYQSELDQWRLMTDTHIKNAQKRFDNDQHAIQELQKRFDNHQRAILDLHRRCHHGHTEPFAPSTKSFSGEKGRVQSLVDSEKSYMLGYGAWADHGGTPTYTNLELETGRMLSALVALHRPKKILETGTHQGYSASIMAEALIDFNIEGHIYTFDPFVVAHLFENNELSEYVTWINDISTHAGKYALPETFDMLFLDSDHTYSTLAQEVALFEPCLEVGGLLVMHDTVIFKDLWPVVDSIEKTGRYQVITFDTPRDWGTKTLNSSGLTVCRKLSSGEAIPVNESFSSYKNIQRYIDERSTFFYKEKQNRSYFFKTQE